MKKKTVYVLGAGFTRAVGIAEIDGREFPSPLDIDFFDVLEQKNLLNTLLKNKPCLIHMLDWLGIYDKNSKGLKQKNFSLEKLWTQISLMLKLNSSISGFPEFGLLPSQGGNISIPNIDDRESRMSDNEVPYEFIPNIDAWKSQMSNNELSLYRVIKSASINFMNPEGTILYLADYEIKELIFEVYSSISYRYEKKELIDKFKEIVCDSTIISFNYDCLVEEIFKKHSVYNYDDRQALEKEKTLIIKPHGSLGWIVKKEFAYEGKKGTIKTVKRSINKKPNPSSFETKSLGNRKLSSNTPIIIPMYPGKENFVSSIDSGKIEIWNDHKLNKKREFIDCVVSYAKMLEVIRQAERVIFIGYSFPSTDYETGILLNLAFAHPPRKECHICVKGNAIPMPDIQCNRLICYKEGFDCFLDNFIPFLVR